MSEVRDHKTITFQQVQKTELVGEWPEYAMISIGMLVAGPVKSEAVKINDDGHIVITVSNASAVYKLDTEQTSEYSLCLVLWKQDIS